MSTTVVKHTVWILWRSVVGFRLQFEARSFFLYFMLSVLFQIFLLLLNVNRIYSSRITINLLLSSTWNEDLPQRCSIDTALGEQVRFTRTS